MLNWLKKIFGGEKVNDEVKTSESEQSVSSENTTEVESNGSTTEKI